MPGQETVKPDPLHSSERFRFIAGVFDDHRQAESLQLLFDLRFVEDHGVFDHQVAVLFQQEFVIRRVILPGIEKAPTLQSLLQLWQMPGGFCRAGKTDPVQCAAAQEQVRNGGTGRVDPLHRRADDRKALRVRRNLRFAVQEQISVLVPQGQNRGAVLPVVHPELLRGAEPKLRGRICLGVLDLKTVGGKHQPVFDLMRFTHGNRVGDHRHTPVEKLDGDLKGGCLSVREREVLCLAQAHIVIVFAAPDEGCGADAVFHMQRRR